jgi:hypothetical protein
MKHDLLLLLLPLVGACSDNGSLPATSEGVDGSSSKLDASAVVSSSSGLPAQVASEAPAPHPSLSNRFEDRSSEPYLRRPLVPRLRTGDFTVNGGLAPEVIQRIVRQHFGSIRLCYEEALALDVAAEGKLTVSFVIETDGSVKDMKTETDLKDSKLVECARKVFERLDFPKPEGGIVDVRFPLLFSAPEFAFTINGKHSHKIQADDVKQAIVDAGFTVLKSGPKPGFPEATLFVLKKDGLELKLTFDPYDSLEGGSSGEQVGARKASREYERLAKEAVLLIEGRLVLAAECTDRAQARALLEAIAKPTKR